MIKVMHAGYKSTDAYRLFPRSVRSRAPQRRQAVVVYPHQIVRMILMKQVYRRFKIVRGDAYHA